MMREKSSYSFSRSLGKGQDHSFFKDLTGIFCTVGGILVQYIFIGIFIHRINSQKKFNDFTACTSR
jgi:hypothetical protein